MVWFLVCLVAYFVGSIPVAYIAVKKAEGVDIRQVGSGNVGTTNSMRTAGYGVGALVLLLDVLKGLVPVWGAKLIGGEALAMLAGLCMLAGHVFPVWLQFRGGKGVAVTLGAGLALVPKLALIGVLVWAVLLVVTGYVSLGSCLGVLAVAVACLVTAQHWLITLMFFIFSVVVMISHRENFVRLAQGKEQRLIKIFPRWF